MQTGTFSIQKSDGRVEAFNPQLIKDRLIQISKGINYVNIQEISQVLERSLYHGVSTEEIDELAIKELTARIEVAPEYGVAAANYQYDVLRRSIRKNLGLAKDSSMSDEFIEYMTIGVEQQILDTNVISRYDLRSLSTAIDYKRNEQFTYLGITTLMDRYLIRNRDRFIIEDPQHMFMRVAMGLAQQEAEAHHWAIEFYNLLSSFDYMTSTPTLFNSSTVHPQLSSCYLTTIPDDLYGIYNSIRDNAMLSKFAGGIGNDWTNVRALGSMIKGTNGPTQGTIPFLKVANDTAIAVNQGSRRKGAVCAYMETWHLDIEEFLDLRKNTGDERRRTHDMNTANWIPDLFILRVFNDDIWTLFSPSDVPDLHHLYGKEFEQKYVEAEAKTHTGEIKHFRRIKAVDLWRKMLTMLFETGHPWLTFKDTCNIRSPQDHVGVVHSSNLCCIAGDQRAVTDRGIVTVKELYSVGGKNQTVGLTGVDSASEMLLPRPNTEMGMIHTEEGFTHKVTPDHPVWVRDRGWVEAQDLVAGDILVLQQHQLHPLGQSTPDHNDDASFDSTALKTMTGLPYWLWTATKETGLAVIAGLSDADPFSESVCFEVGVEQTARDLQIFLLAYGVYSVLRYCETQALWVLTTRPATQTHDHVAVFSHYERFEELEDAYCLMVDSETHAWTVNGFITKNTEITLNTSDEEVAVCNLGSINLVQHVDDYGRLQLDKVAQTIKVAVRMLDNIMDINYYPVPQAKVSNMRHRPIGLGIMGFQDALYKARVSYASEKAVALADEWMEHIGYFALEASSDLAAERGAYESFKGSKWDRGLLPIDTITLVKATRPEGRFLQDESTRRGVEDWDKLRLKIQTQGMRNSNVMAIAPTATISNICGVSQSIEPQFQNLFVKSNLSGEFTIINESLVKDLRSLGLWDKEMIDSLKASDGSVQNIARVPQTIKDLYRTAFEVEPRFLVESASRRQKWIDQAQSLNLYICEPNGKKLDTTYKMAWLLGLKTTYYLRAMSATHTEKSTVTTGELNTVSATVVSAPQACSIDNPDCESCQ